MQIIFRQLNDNIPLGWVAGVRWIVEAYPGEPGDLVDLPFPMGQAWVSDYNPHNNLTSLDFILTADQYRQQGVGKALYEAIKKRWPNVFVTDAISVSGERFLDRVEPWRGKAKENQRKDELRKKLRKKKQAERQRKKR